MARRRVPTLAVIEDHCMLSMQRPSRDGSNQAWGSHQPFSSEELTKLGMSSVNTPTAEDAPSYRGVSGYPASSSFVSTNPHDDVFYDRVEAKDDTLDITKLSATTKPIPITGRRRDRSDFGGVEALSARGDLQGGYFPLHESHGPHVYYPHPFYEDTARARRLSIQHASKEALLSSASLDQTWTFGNMSSDSPQRSPACSPGSPDTVTAMSASVSPHIPVSSYLPTGVHGYAALPTGKYYPTNWEKRKGHRQPEMASSDPQGAGHRRPSHNRNGSDTKPRLVQYRRDMITQATVVGSTMAQSHDSAAGLGALLKSHKPLSPRLAPLGSPGPVTPMNLEGAVAGDSYLTLGRTVTGSNATQP